MGVAFLKIIAIKELFLEDLTEWYLFIFLAANFLLHFFFNF